MFSMIFFQAGGGFYRKSGLGALPVGLFNGIPLGSEEMDPEELETVLLQKIMETTNFFQREVFMVGCLFGFISLTAFLQIHWFDHLFLSRIHLCDVIC